MYVPRHVLRRADALTDDVAGRRAKHPSEAAASGMGERRAPYSSYCSMQDQPLPPGWSVRLFLARLDVVGADVSDAARFLPSPSQPVHDSDARQLSFGAQPSAVAGGAPGGEQWASSRMCGRSDPPGSGSIDRSTEGSSTCARPVHLSSRRVSCEGMITVDWEGT